MSAFAFLPVAGVLLLAAGNAQAQTIDFTGVNLTTVSSVAGQTFSAGAGGTVNVRLISGQVDSLTTGSSPDATGFYAIQSDPSQPEVFQFTLSKPQTFTITQNETVTNLETNAFSLPSGSWTVNSSSNVTVNNSGSSVFFHGTNGSAPYGDYKITGSGSTFNFTITDSPGISQYGSAISLKLNGVASAPEPGSMALLGTALLPVAGFAARRRRAV